MVEDYTASNTQEEVDKNVENGITFKFDTIEELCEHCGFDKDIFIATFTRYNELCARPARISTSTRIRCG